MSADSTPTNDDSTSQNQPTLPLDLPQEQTPQPTQPTPQTPRPQKAHLKIYVIVGLIISIILVVVVFFFKKFKFKQKQDDELDNIGDHELYPFCPKHGLDLPCPQCKSDSQ